MQISEAPEGGKNNDNYILCLNSNYIEGGGGYDYVVGSQRRTFLYNQLVHLVISHY